MVGGIPALRERLSRRAIDLSDGSLLDQSEHPAIGLENWRKYRSQVTGEYRG